MHIYCINLERRPDRNTRARAEFKRLDIGPVEFFRATDGKSDAPMGTHVTSSEYGCASSHVRVWRDMVAHGYEQALVFEDDVSLVPDFKSKLQNLLDEAPDDWDMIFIGHITPIWGRQVSRGLMEARPLGTHSYIIRLECAQKICNFDPKLMRVGIDFQLNRFPIKILCSLERLTSQGDELSQKGFMSFKSMVEGDIGPNRTLDWGFLIPLYWPQLVSIFILLACR